jgi:hypothetical protein
MSLTEGRRQRAALVLQRIRLEDRGVMGDDDDLCIQIGRSDSLDNVAKPGAVWKCKARASDGLN